MAIGEIIRQIVVIRSGLLGNDSVGSESRVIEWFGSGGPSGFASVEGDGGEKGVYAIVSRVHL